MPNPMAYFLAPLDPWQVDRFASEEYRPYDNPFELPSIGITPAPFCRSSLAASHPEGSIIYYDDSIVSCQPITPTHISLAQCIYSECEEHITEGVVTVFLKLTGLRVEYYVVDHKTQSIAWVADNTADSFRWANSAKLHHEYWTHMENFPAPYFSTPEDLQLLKDTLTSYAAGSLSSNGSASPMTNQQIDSHLKTLDTFGSEGNINQTYTTARLWNSIIRSMVKSYGESEARLDRLTSTFDNPPQFPGVYASCSNMFSGLGGTHLRRFSRAWKDRIAYVAEWHKPKAINEAGWTQVIQLSGASILASHMILAPNTGFLRVFPHISLPLALPSVARDYHIFNDPRNLGGGAVNASASFQLQEEVILSVQHIALWNASPQGLMLWSIIFLVLSIILAVLSLLNV